jgi:hypothetical protein
MYDLIKKHLEKLSYRIIVDKPKGSGIKFRSLKGWTIDVVGVKKAKSPEVVAIEVKRNLGSSSVLDALSKAEMYRNVCTEVYIAFPKGSLHVKENRVTVREIRQECKRRGIGLMEVGEECREVIPAVPSSLRVDMLREILNELEKKSSKFNGFEEEDFVKYYSYDEEDVVRHKFKLLIREVEERLKARGLVLTHRPRGEKWWYSFSRKLSRGERYFDVPHFTVSFWGVGIMAELIIRESSYLNQLRKKIEKNPRPFVRIIQRLKEKFPCEIRVKERVHIGGYETETSSEYAVFSQHLDQYYARKLKKWILRKTHKGKKWLWIGHLFHLHDEETGSEELVERIQEFVEGLTELYEFVIQK